jgi:hypothetical protein
MKGFLLIISTVFLLSCGGSECSFESLESGVDCACEYAEKIKAVPGQTSDLQDEIKALKDDFEAAIEAGTFTKEIFTNKLKEECPSYLEIIE